MGVATEVNFGIMVGVSFRLVLILDINNLYLYFNNLGFAEELVNATPLMDEFFKKYLNMIIRYHCHLYIR